jgi:hypothetical protein
MLYIIPDTQSGRCIVPIVGIFQRVFKERVGAEFSRIKFCGKIEAPALGSLMLSARSACIPRTGIGGTTRNDRVWV